MKNAKKMNYLAIIPLWGSVILIIYSFIKTVQSKLMFKDLLLFLLVAGLGGGILFTGARGLVILLLGTRELVDKYELILTMVVGGYLMNLVAFLWFNKKTYLKIKS